MKKLFLSLLTLVFSFNLFAQSATNTTNTAVYQSVENMVESLSLNQSQLAKIQKIKDRMQSQLKEISSLKETNVDAYYSKLKEIVKGNKISFTMLLNKEQLKDYDVINRQKRIARAEKLKELKNQGLSRIEIERAFLEMEVE